MEDRAALGEEALEISVLNEGDHEKEEADRKEKHPRKRIGGPNQELVMGRGAQKFGGDLVAMAEDIDFLHVEHHQGPTGGGDQRV